MMARTTMVRKLLSLPKKQNEIIEKISGKLGISFSEMIRRIIDEYINKNWKEE